MSAADVMLSDNPREICLWRECAAVRCRVYTRLNIVSARQHEKAIGLFLSGPNIIRLSVYFDMSQDEPYPWWQSLLYYTILYPFDLVCTLGTKRRDLISFRVCDVSLDWSWTNSFHVANGQANISKTTDWTLKMMFFL